MFGACKSFRITTINEAPAAVLPQGALSFILLAFRRR